MSYPENCRGFNAELDRVIDLYAVEVKRWHDWLAVYESEKIVVNKILKYRVHPKGKAYYTQHQDKFSYNRNILDGRIYRMCRSLGIKTSEHDLH